MDFLGFTLHLFLPFSSEGGVDLNTDDGSNLANFINFFNGLFEGGDVSLAIGCQRVVRNVFDKGANVTLQRGSKAFLCVFKEFCAFRIIP